MRRRLWLARVRFHDWMWGGGPLPSLPRYLARRLPLYFSDPYWEDPAKLRARLDVTLPETGVNMSTATTSVRIIRCTAK